MKYKKIIILTAVTVFIMSLHLVSGVLAADYPTQYVNVDTILDFEQGYVEGDSKVLLETGTPTGNALKLKHDALLHISLGDAANEGKYAITEGKYLISYDAFMSSDDGGVQLRAYAWTRETINPDKWGPQEVFLTLNGGKASAGIKQTLFDGVYKPMEWNHYDFLVTFGAGVTPTVEAYINGAYCGIADLSVNTEKVPINGISRLIFQMGCYGDGLKDNYALFDNFMISEYSDDISLETVLTDSNEIRINLSQGIPNLTKSDIAITREPISGGMCEEIDFEIELLSDKNILIKPKKSDSGYRYSVKFLKQTTFGKDIPISYVNIYKSENVNISWDFESGDKFDGLKNEHFFVSEENRGNVLDINGADTLRFKTPSEMINGRYIVSYDLKHDAGEKKLCYIRPAIDGAWGNYQVLDPVDGIKAIDNNNVQTFIGNNQMTFEEDTWYRVDNVFDLNTKTANVYVNGTFFGTSKLWNKYSDKVGAIKSFEGINIQWAGGAGQIDNVRIKNVDGVYNADVKIDGDKIYIDFDETMPELSSANFAVSKSDDIFADGTAEEFNLIYQNGTRVILRLLGEAEQGKYYFVELKDIQSFIKSEAENKIIKTVVQGDNQSYIEQIKLIDAYGRKSELNNVSSATESIALLLPNGMQQDSGDIQISCNGEIISCSRSFDEQNNCLTLAFEKLLGANRTYTVTIDNLADSGGKPYKSLSAIFTTGNEIADFSDIAVKKTDSSAEVQLKYINTKEDADFYLILTGYKDGYLNYAEAKPVNSVKNSAATDYIETYESERLSECDRVSAFIWKSWRDIKPITAHASN